MMRTLTAASLSAALALGLFVQPAQAGLLQAIDTAMNNYAANIVKQGEQATNDVKNGSIKNLYNDAWVNYAASFHEEGKLGGDALKDSKAIFAEIKKIVMWVPNKIREIWNKIIDGLKWVRDRIGAAGPGWPPPNAGGGAAAVAEVAPTEDAGSLAIEGSLPAEEGGPAAPDDSAPVRASAGLGDGFLAKFAATKNFGAKFQVFTGYQARVAQARGWFASLQPQEQKALTPNLSKVVDEANQMEDIFAREVAGSQFDAFMKAASSMDPKTAKSSIRGLLAKVTKQVNMKHLGNKADKAAARKAQQLATLKVKLGL